MQTNNVCATDNVCGTDKVCVIVGASHAAAQLAPSLRQEGWDGEIIVIGEEPFLPYHRPPLSKDFLAGSKSLGNILIRNESAYQKLGIKFILGVRAQHINRKAKSILLSNGESIHYDKLALTVGSRVRQIPLPGNDLPGIFYLRNIKDIEGIKPYATPGKKAVICGGGYIGLETAAALKKLGLEITVLEMMPRILQRVATPELSAFYTRVHAAEGVKIITDVGAKAFAGTQTVEHVICTDDSTHNADLVIIGVGVLPNIELAQEAGLETNNGIVVDHYARTNDPDIVAAGDCTFHYNRIYDRSLRLESVQNAVDQAKIAAATLCGHLKQYDALPWFWSDQFDLSLRIAGLSEGFEDIIVRGDMNNSRSFAVFYLKAGRVISVDTVNKPQEFMIGKRLIKDRVLVDKVTLGDETIPIKNVI